ncbi:MAG: hypothetical protein OHK0039_26530 [Bacteroidia bacterium]
MHKQILILALIGLFAKQATGQGLQVDIGPDTVYACAGTSWVLSGSIQGGTAPYTLWWSTGEQTEDIVVQVGNDTLVYSLVVTDASNTTVEDSVLVIGLPECVWPGDANGDGTANNHDVLMLGYTYGAQGMVRPNAHLQWIGQAAPAWGHTTSGGVNYVHADTDGDGVVGATDLMAVGQNYATAPMSMGSSPVVSWGIPIYVDFSGVNYQGGDTIVAPIMLGSAAFPADSVYGLAFSVQYGNLPVVPGSVQISYDGSWLGTLQQDMIALDKDFAQGSIVEVGMSRTDHVPRLGYGRLGDITVVIDDIAGKRSGIEYLNVLLAGITLLDQHGQVLPVQVLQSKLAIVMDIDGQTWPAGVQVAQVAQQQAVDILLDGQALSRRWSYRLLDMQGRTLWQGDLRTQEQRERIAFPTVSGGLYVLHLSAEDKAYSRLLVFP